MDRITICNPESEIWGQLSKWEKRWNNYVLNKTESDVFQRNGGLKTFTQALQSCVGDFVAASKSVRETWLLNLENLPVKAKINSLQGDESFQSFTNFH